MPDDTEIPVLIDLIEKGIEIKLSELGLNLSPLQNQHDLLDRQPGNPVLEQEVRRILDEHLELAWQEIKIAIQRSGSHSLTDTTEYSED
jgi:hypothetical protein